MNSRERTFAALQHRPGDRIPIDFWATPAVSRAIQRDLGLTREAFLDRYDVDLRYIAGPAYIGPALEEGTDIWGVRRHMLAAGSPDKSEDYSEVAGYPLATLDTVEAIERYPHWPDPDWFDYRVIEAQCDAILAKDRVVVFMGDRLNRIAQFKPAMYLRGTEEIFVDLATQPAIAEEIFRKIRAFYLDYLDRILKAAKGKIDIVLTGDDFGAQNGMLISTDMWREFLRPGFAEYIRLIKRHRATVMHHTCGAVLDIIPDMISCELDVLQSVQPEATGMTLADLKRRFGKDLCFQGGVSIQKTMPYGTPDDIRRDVRDIAATIKPDAGYIFCTSHNIQADTPVRNVVALMEAYLEYGAY
jgi:uroporphyrinogen decarboxylase